MAAKLPVTGMTEDASLMAFGFDPYLTDASPFHGAVKAVVESLAKIVAVGGSHENARLTFQEYFERLEDDPYRWQKPFLALLGAFWVQMGMGVPAIGGKDSMSGTYENKDVPPTFVSFCVQTAKTPQIASQELKAAGRCLVWLRAEYNEYDIPDFLYLKKSFARLTSLIRSGLVTAAYALDANGLAGALAKMALGNGIGVNVRGDCWFFAETGSFLLEMAAQPDEALEGLRYEMVGMTINEPLFIVNGISIPLSDCHDAWLSTLEPVFPTGRFNAKPDPIPEIPPYREGSKKTAAARHAKPRICMPIFPGTNGEYEITRAFTEAGGRVDGYVLCGLSASILTESLKELEKRIRNAQILMLPGGVSGGYELDAGGKFVAAVLRNPRITEAVRDFLNRDGLILGIGDGFQALLKTGLLPYGDICPVSTGSPTLTRNVIGRFVSDLVMVKTISSLSIWLANTQPGQIRLLPVAHAEGRFMADSGLMNSLIKERQIAAQYVDFEGNPSMDIRFNPFGSHYAVEAISSPDGRILGKMGHSERIGKGLYKGFEMPMDQGIFKAGTEYYN
jgi:phosphoribosylformylglycinamidine synthase